MTTKKKSLTSEQYVYQEMFDAVLTQQLLPGMKLTEESITSIFGVSRAVVRRVFLRLSSDGIVDIRPNLGAMIASPSVKDAKEILQARRLIEPTIVKAACEHITKTSANELREIVKQEHAFFERDNRGSGIRVSGDFHLKLAEISGNTTLTAILNRLVPQTSLIIAQYEKPGHSPCSYDEHLALIDCVVSGESEAAVLMMDEHLQGIEKKLILQDESRPADLEQIFSHIKPK